MSERSRSRSLIDLLQEAKVDFNKGIDAELLTKQKDLTDELNNKYRLREDLLRSKSKPEQIDKINSEINDFELAAKPSVFRSVRKIRVMPIWSMVERLPSKMFKNCSMMKQFCSNTNSAKSEVSMARNKEFD